MLAGYVASDAVEVDVRGALGPADADLARARVAEVLAAHRLALAGTRIRLTGSACGNGRALIQVNLLLDGMPARIQVPGRGVTAAIAAGAERLGRQIRRIYGPWEEWPWPDPQRRPLATPSPGTINRIKAVSLATTSPHRAAVFMSAMDYVVHLFADAETGQDAIVYRAGPTGVRLARQRSMRPPTNPAAFTVNPHRIPTLTVDHAAQRLVESGLPYIFFTDLATRRGNLLYRRYDGALTLVCPGRDTHDIAKGDGLWAANPCAAR